MRSVYLVGALDAKVHGRGRLGGESDGYPMIVTHFARLCAARVWTGVSLAHERGQVICGYRNAIFELWRISILLEICLTHWRIWRGRPCGRTGWDWTRASSRRAIWQPRLSRAPCRRRPRTGCPWRRPASTPSNTPTIGNGALENRSSKF